MIRAGMKVELVDSTGWGARLYLRWSYPRKGVVYTVRESLLDASGERCIRLVEIANGDGRCIKTGDFGEPFFAARRFRPVVERKTDISIFQAMLTPSPVTVDAMKLADHAREIVG